MPQRKNPELDSPAGLAADIDVDSYAAAVDYDRVLGQTKFSDRTLARKALSYREAALEQIKGTLHNGPPILEIGWPSYLYIPSQADHRPYWFVPPPDSNRYQRQWAPPPSPAGFNKASAADGTLHVQQRIRTTDTYVQAEAGLGIFYTPTASLSEITVEADVRCSGEHRWFNELDRLFVGHTTVRASLFVVAWHQIPTGYDLIGSRRFEVVTAGPNTGLGQSAITPYSRSFSGSQLATPFVVQQGRTYLLGIVARVSVWSTLTDDRGRPLPLIENGTFRVWGSLACAVPTIEVHRTRVHIP
jgi:hypothetical protein